jgi:hypothetical protein
MKLTKKSVFYLSIIPVLIFIGLGVSQNTFCYETSWCRNKWEFINILGSLLISFFPVFLLSLVTFWMKEEVFKAWYKVASWFVPVIVLTTIYLNATSSSGGFFNMDKEINFLILLILYSIFVLTSIWKIVTTYRKTKSL